MRLKAEKKRKTVSKKRAIRAKRDFNYAFWRECDEIKRKATGWEDFSRYSSLRA